MTLDAEAWVEIARLYRDSEIPVTEIAARFGIDSRQIYQRRKYEGWPLRSARNAAPGTAAASRSGQGKSRKSNKTATKAKPRDAASKHDRAAMPMPSQPEAEPARPNAGGATTAASRKALVRRLYRAIDVKLQRLEKRMTSGKEPTIADSERETRELAHMIRSFEKVTEVAADIANKHSAQHATKPAPGSARDGDRKHPAAGYVSADAERMRHEIAERLERLHRARASGK